MGGINNTKYSEIESIKEMIENGKVIFEYNEEASKVINTIESYLNESISVSLEKSNNKLKNKIRELIPLINKNIKNELGDLINIIQKRVGGNIDINLPEIVFIDNKISTKNTFKDIISSKTEKKSYTRVNNSFTNWFNSDWGITTEYYDKTTHTIRRKDIIKRINDKFEEVSKNIQKNTEYIYTKDIQEVVANSIKNLTIEIEEYRGEMIEVTNQRERDKENIQNERLLIRKHSQDVKKLIKRASDTKQILTIR